MKLLARVSTILDRAFNFLAYCICVLLVSTMLIVSLEVIMRYFFNRPQTWVVEVAEYSIFYITFLGAAWLLRHEGHVNVDLLLARLSPRGNALLTTITSILGAVTCLAITWYGALGTWTSFHSGFRTFTAMELIQWPFVMVIPVGSFLLFLQFLRRTHGYWGKVRAFTK